MNRLEQKMVQQANKPKESYALNPVDEIFKGDPIEKALELQSKDKEDKEIEKKESPKRTIMRNKKKKSPSKQLNKPLNKKVKKKRLTNKKVKKNKH